MLMLLSVKLLENKTTFDLFIIYPRILAGRLILILIGWNIF